MINSIKNRLLAWFIAFMLLTAGLIIPAHLIFQKKEKRITEVASEINKIQIQFLTDHKTVNDFITTEPDNVDFFIRGESSYLKFHRNLSRKLNADLEVLRNSDKTPAFGISKELDQLAIELNHYNILFDSLIYLVYKRGYANFGLEGELTDYGVMIDRAPGLSGKDKHRIRKVENDYFFKKDASSASSLQHILAEVSRKVTRNPSLSAFEKNRTITLVNNYTEAFKRLIEVDSKAGISTNRSLRASLNKTSNKIGIIFTNLSSETVAAEKALVGRLKVYYALSVLLVLSLALFFSYKASRHIVSNLEALTNYISSLAANKTDSTHYIDLHNSAREIRQIYREFRNLLSQLKIWEKQRDSAIRNADDNQQRYRELADMLPQSVFETDLYGNYTYVNKAWHQAFGYAENDLQEGLNLIETLISDDEDILGSGRIENSSFMALKKNGSKFPASVYSDMIIRNGKPAGRRGIIVDITDRVDYIRTLQQDASKARTSDELKSSFLANMSHEIRTPMNSIIGFSNLLASEQIPETQKKDFTEYIRNSSEHLLNLVDDIIDISKIEAGELKIVKKDCNLNVLCAELLHTSVETRNRFNKQHIDLKYKPGASDIFLKTDPFRLHQVLVNLINNAIKFTENGSVEFGFTVKEDALIEFYVRDTGPGLSRDELDMIFERFKRSRRSEEKNIHGTGLGLAIAKNLVQLLGGEMWVDSAAGSGTTFLFTIPYLKLTQLTEEKQKLSAGEDEYSWPGTKVLVVEDDLNNYKFLQELLKRTQVEILHASNGRKAVELVSATPGIDLVIMDIQLPVMDGTEATRLIKQMKPNLPVIAQTAYAMAGDREKMKQAGCDDYVAKPIDVLKLMATMHHYLGKKKADHHQPQNTSSTGHARIISN